MDAIRLGLLISKIEIGNTRHRYCIAVDFSNCGRWQCKGGREICRVKGAVCWIKRVKRQHMRHAFWRNIVTSQVGYVRNLLQHNRGYCSLTGKRREA